MRFCRSTIVVAMAMVSLHAVAANPLTVVGETWSHWKERLFGSGHRTPATIDAPARGPIALLPGHPQRLHVDSDAPERDFSKSSSHYRLIELPRELEHAAVRIQVIAQKKGHGRGHVVFKPLLYVLGDDDKPRDLVVAQPVHLDIRPFRRTRLLGCVTLEKVQRFAVATAADAVDKSYESEVRDAIKAPTQYGFQYSTDAVKVNLPYATSGVLVIEVTEGKSAGTGC